VYNIYPQFIQIRIGLCARRVAYRFALRVCAPRHTSMKCKSICEDLCSCIHACAVPTHFASCYYCTKDHAQRQLDLSRFINVFVRLCLCVCR
jgi:hypothetical protein